MAQSTAVGNSEIKVKATVEFFHTPINSFRAQLCEINGNPYVGLVKFWKPEKSEFYIPTRKSIFLTRDQWNSLCLASPGVNKAFNTFANDGLGKFSLL